MNSITPHEDDVLARALRGQVDGMTEAPLTFDRIAGRARGLQRRRRIAVAGGVAAAVAAILIPAASLSGGLWSRSDGPRRVEPLEPVSAPLTLSIEGLPTGEAPGVGWVEDGTAHLPDGSEMSLPTPADDFVSSVTAFEGSLLVVTIDDRGVSTLTVAGEDGDLVSSDATTGSPVVSADGTVAAYVRTDGTPVLLLDAGRSTQLLAPTPAQSPLVAAVDGTAPCDDGCRVWANDGGRRAAAFEVDEGGATRVQATDHVRAVTGDRLLGNVGLKEDLFPVDGLFRGAATQPEWTVVTTLKGFSPDGRWVVGQFGEGLGATELRILDAETGEPQVRWQWTVGEGATAFGDPVWEDDTHLLQVLTQGRDVVVARFGLDGSFELTGVAQRVDDPTLSTLALASR